jgi:hypothetical protein
MCKIELCQKSPVKTLKQRREKFYRVLGTDTITDIRVSVLLRLIS